MSLDNQLTASFSKENGDFSKKLIVIKVGGDLLNKEDLSSISEQIACLYKKGAKIAIVHGGAPAIDEELERLNMPIKQDYETGMRLTDYETLKIADKVLLQKNAEFVEILSEKLGDKSKVLGMSGYDDDMVLATKAKGHYSGEATKINVNNFNFILNRGIIPVINPICKNERFEGIKGFGGIEVFDNFKINPNGDDIALRMFEQLKATDLLLCSDTPVWDAQKRPISELSHSKVAKMIEDGTIQGGMITKVKRAAEALEANSSGHVYILDGKAENAIKNALEDKSCSCTRITGKNSYKPAPVDKPLNLIGFSAV